MCSGSTFLQVRSEHSVSPKLRLQHCVFANLSYPPVSYTVVPLGSLLSYIKTGQLLDKNGANNRLELDLYWINTGQEVDKTLTATGL